MDETPAQRLDRRRQQLKAAKRHLNEAREQIIRVGGRLEGGMTPTNSSKLFRSRTKESIFNLLPGSATMRQDLLRQLQVAQEKEKEALEEVAEATSEYDAAHREFLVSTVAPRVEAAKLRHEEHKQRATVSATSIVGISATSALLLPRDPSHVWLLVLSLAFLFFCTAWSLWDMERTSQYVEDTLIREAIAPPRGVIAGLLWVARNTVIIGLILFAGFVALNL